MSVEKELIAYLKVLWRFKWVIAACTIIAVVVALGISYRLTPLYEGTATVRVATAPGGMSDYSYLSALMRMTNTLVEIATSETTLDEVVKKLGLTEQPKVEAEVVAETELIKITATNPDPGKARDIANMLAQMMVDQSVQFNGGNTPSAREILEGQLTQAKIDLDTAVSGYDNALRCADSAKSFSTMDSPISCPNAETLAHILSVRQGIYADLLQKYEDARTSEQLRANAVTIIDVAKLPQRPSSPKVTLNAILGLLAGFVMGIVLAFIFAAMDDTLQTTEDVQAMTTQSILCQIPKRKLTADSVVKAILSRQNRFLPMPAFYQLRARMLFIKARTKATSFLLTSPEPGAGKSTIASNLSVSLAEAGHQVVLIDMDFHRPCLHSIFDLPTKDGLSDYLCGKIQLNDALQEVRYPNLRVAVAGSSLNEISKRLAPDKIGELLKALGQDADFVLVDAPAFLSVADPALIVPKADQVIVVAARQKTGRKQLALTLQQLAELNANLAGIVLNRTPNSRLYTYYYGGHKLDKVKPNPLEGTQHQAES